MKPCSNLVVMVVILGLVAPALLLAGPVTGPEAERQKSAIELLKRSVAEEKTDEGRFALISRVMTAEGAVMVRRKVLEVATRYPGPKLNEFLARVLAMDEDAGVRSEAATALGKFGSEKQLAALADAARNDRTTDILIGDIGGKSSARRAATFAIAELAARFPKLADEAAAKLRELPVKDDPKDHEGLADARIQALYHITREELLLKPFYERLKSTEAEVRMNGIVAFQFLKLKVAPAETVTALKDSSPDVRSWAALVLGGIGDDKTADALMAVASDEKEVNNVRCNAVYSLGQMKSASAAGLMEKLLADPQPGLQSNAAIALYRITGKKVKQFPEEYNAD